MDLIDDFFGPWPILKVECLMLSLPRVIATLYLKSHLVECFEACYTKTGMEPIDNACRGKFWENHLLPAH